MIANGTLIARRYRVMGLLGEGSMGTVVEAEHVRIGKRVAIKLLHERYSRNERAVARFVREARAAGAVGHPNIVEATDFGQHRERPYFVMELLRGEDLAMRLARTRKVPAAEACAIVGHVLSALASAHAAGIVHRDLKPENIYLVERAGVARATVKLLDFGLSKFRRSDGTSLLETQDGVMMGTPAYMAPEQWMGRRDTDHRADLFAVGVVLYELLTAKLPYNGETQGELFQAIVNGTAAPPPPSALEPSVPGALDAVALRAVERDPRARFQTAQEFLEALRAFGAGEITAVSAPPVSAPLDEPDEPPGVLRASARSEFDERREGRASRWRRGAWATGGAVALALVAAVAVFALRAPGAPQAARPAAAPRASAVVASVAPIAPPSPPRPAAPPPPSPVESDEVRIELRGLPPGARVRLDGLLQDSATLSIPRTDRARRVEVQAGTQRRAIEIRPDRDQVVVVDLPGGGGATGAATAPAGSPGTPPRRTASAPLPRGIGAINVSHEF